MPIASTASTAPAATRPMGLRFLTGVVSRGFGAGPCGIRRRVEVCRRCAGGAGSTAGEGQQVRQKRRLSWTKISCTRAPQE
jgi:hypothetical protein